MELLRIILGGVFVAAVVWAAGQLAARRSPLPASVRFSTGAALVSSAVFLLLQLQAGYLPIFLTLGAAVLVAAVLRSPAPVAPGAPLPQPWRTLYWLTFLGFAAWYIVFALAPEIEADAVGYHLGLVSEYVRRHTMPARVSFFDLLPQGLDMLFVPAFAIGRHSAAKLVHFAFLLNLVPLMRRAGVIAGVGEGAAASGALLLFLSPVAAVDGTAAYTDIALTGAATAVFYLMLRWRTERSPALLLAAGLNAGFCYAIKPTLGLVPVAGLAFIYLRSRSLRESLSFVSGVAICTLPWLGRSLALTGNPFAPFLNKYFPNDGIPAGTEATLSGMFGMFTPAFQWKTAFLDYTIWGGHQGMLGIAFLAAPLALFALRTKAGRLLLGYATLLLLTFPLNAGTRFLMPAAAPLSLALSGILPAPVSIALVALQGAGSVRPVLMKYNIRQDWKLPPFPWRAALRIEPEDEYLSIRFFDYRNSQMIKAHTPPDARIYAMGPFAWAYLDREPMVFWHSTKAQKIWTDLIFVQLSWSKPASATTWFWAGHHFTALRLSAFPDIRIPEARVLPGTMREFSWSPWTAAAPFILDLPANSTGLEAMLWPRDADQLKLELRQPDGAWVAPPAPPDVEPIPATFRRGAMLNIRAQGYSYVLVPVAKDAFEEIGRDMVANPGEWGVELLGEEGNSRLFRILPPG